jgi:hypothetical protein
MLDAIWHDVEAGEGALTDFAQLFRDASGHLSSGVGRSLMHNALRQALGQPTEANATAFGVEGEVKVYLDGVVRAFAPEVLPAFELTPGGTGVVEFGERLRIGRGCEREQAVRSATISLDRRGTFRLQHPGVELTGSVQKLDRKGQKSSLCSTCSRIFP